MGVPRGAHERDYAHLALAVARLLVQLALTAGTRYARWSAPAPDSGGFQGRGVRALLSSTPAHPTAVVQIRSTRLVGR
ncbi:hypothetical protein NDU88_004302 [Pleurodeles waltl]|uniref:Secreted protein n=1 Tax=Pleurodeles waltl TaxID=8319 RepID=A0AAV7QED1_PLEWA|nr:hypothetical protein NDU88_004302 [Pleurodeles waltl]